MALTKAEQRKAADLIRQVLDLVDDGHLTVDGPTGVALVRHLEGAMLALRALAGHTVPTVDTGVTSSNA